MKQKQQVVNSEGNLVNEGLYNKPKASNSNTKSSWQ